MAPKCSKHNAAHLVVPVRSRNSADSPSEHMSGPLKSLMSAFTSTSSAMRHQPLHSEVDGFSVHSTAVEPSVYRQYIYDRISGNSYVPRCERNPDGRGAAQSSAHLHRSDRGSDEDDSCSVDSDYKDMTDWHHRPPHWLCFLPPFVGKFPGLLEQNAVCQWVGQIGFHHYFKYKHTRRCVVFFIGFTFNFISLCLLIVACMAFSTKYNLLTSTSFSRGDVTMPVPDSDGIVLRVAFDMGFRAAAVTDHTGWYGGTQVLTFGSICDEDSPWVILNEAICGECQDSSNMFVVSCLFNLFVILKNMLSDITRMYPRYDLNCPNFMGSLMAITSVLIGLYTIYTYKGRCLDNLTEEREEITFEDAVRWMNFPPDILEKLENAESLAIDIDWYAGPGLLCLVVATFLRILDTICNFIVPTPSITRGEVEQERYELEFGELPPEERRELSKKIRRSELLNPDMLLDDNFYRENSRKKLWVEPTAAVDSSGEDSPDQIVDVDGDAVSDEYSWSNLEQNSKPPEDLYIETDPIVVEEPSQDLNLESDPIVVEEPSEEWPMMENITVDVDRNPYDDRQEELLASLSFESSKSLKSPSFEDGHAV